MAILLSLSDANGIVFLLRKGYRQFERSLLSCIQTEGVRFAQSEHLFLLYKQHTANFAKSFQTRSSFTHITSPAIVS